MTKTTDKLRTRPILNSLGTVAHEEAENSKLIEGMVKWEEEKVLSASRMAALKEDQKTPGYFMKWETDRLLSLPKDEFMDAISIFFIVIHLFPKNSSSRMLRPALLKK